MVPTLPPLHFSNSCPRPCLVLRYNKGPANFFAEMKTIKNASNCIREIVAKFGAAVHCTCNLWLGGAWDWDQSPLCSSWPGLSQGEVSSSNKTGPGPRVPPSPWALLGPILFLTLHVYTCTVSLQHCSEHCMGSGQGPRGGLQGRQMRVRDRGEQNC